MTLNSDVHTLVVICKSGVQRNVRKRRNELLNISLGSWEAFEWTQQTLFLLNRPVPSRGWRLCKIKNLMCCGCYLLAVLLKKKHLQRTMLVSFTESDSLQRIFLYRMLSASRTLPPSGYIKNYRFSSPEDSFS